MRFAGLVVAFVGLGYVLSLSSAGSVNVGRCATGCSAVGWPSPYRLIRMPERQLAGRC
jgi:hypothetical protein